MPKFTENKLQCHLFICTNTRDDDEACGNKGSCELREKVKGLVKEKGLQNIKVTKSGCLGFCSEGIAAVMYPQQKFITELKQDDEQALLKIIEDTQK
jgi:predicted metal-binding protein